ncbi:hypothetical protein pb186bvf_013478 [Paramecium bursaria]
MFIYTKYYNIKPLIDQKQFIQDSFHSFELSILI